MAQYYRALFFRSALHTCSGTAAISPMPFKKRPARLCCGEGHVLALEEHNFSRMDDCVLEMKESQTAISFVRQ